MVFFETITNDSINNSFHVLSGDHFCLSKNVYSVSNLVNLNFNILLFLDKLKNDYNLFL